jgi:hypothetical protein
MLPNENLTLFTSCNLQPLKVFSLHQSTLQASPRKQVGSQVSTENLSSLKNHSSVRLAAWELHLRYTKIVQTVV